MDLQNLKWAASTNDSLSNSISQLEFFFNNSFKSIANRLRCKVTFITVPLFAAFFECVSIHRFLSLSPNMNKHRNKPWTYFIFQLIKCNVISLHQLQRLNQRNTQFVPAFVLCQKKIDHNLKKTILLLFASVKINFYLIFPNQT